MLNFVVITKFTQLCEHIWHWGKWQGDSKYRKQARKTAAFLQWIMRTHGLTCTTPSSGTQAVRATTPHDQQCKLQVLLSLQIKNKET